MNTKLPGILKFMVGNRSLDTFRLLWQQIQGWECFLYITDGYKVYPCLIEDGDHLVSKTAMTRAIGRKLSIAALSCTSPSQNSVLFQIDRNVESFSAIARLLFSASINSSIGLNHSFTVQRPAAWRKE